MTHTPLGGRRARTDAARPYTPAQTPSPARMYNEALGGKDYYSIDLKTNRRIYDAVGEDTARKTASENDRWRQRCTRWLAGQAITQYIDIGCGLSHSHDETTYAIATERLADAAILYIDSDPGVALNAEVMSKSPRVAVLTRDARDPFAILSAPETRRLIDFTTPVALLFIAVAHFLTDADDPAAILTTFCDALPSGSYLAISHFCPDSQPPHLVASWRQAFEGATSPLVFRTREQIAALLPPRWEWIEPGLVPPATWHPHIEGAPSTHWLQAGLAYKP